MPDTSPVYQPRKPQNSQYYQRVEDHFETLEQVYDERFAKQYGFFRPYVRKVIYRYLDCGILHNGFARVKCEDCNHEFLLAFPCKRHHFCPSCHQKRVVEFGEWLCEEVLKAVPHRHFVFSIPKILRRYFLYDRKLLSDLSRCAWRYLKVFEALEWLAAMCTHLPNKGEQMVRCYGYYSNVSRGRRKKSDQDELIPSILEPDGSSIGYRKNWARLIQKIYEVDPLTCPKCQGWMRIISFIEDDEVIKKILKHLGLWKIKVRPPPKATGPPKAEECHIDASISQLPVSDNWLYVDPQYPDEFSA